MTLYKTDFSEYTTDAQPSDWTERWNASLASITVKTLSGGIGGKSLLLVHGATNNKYFSSWDDIASTTGNVEILARMKGSLLESGSFSTDGIRLIARANESAVTGYCCNINRNTDGTIRLVITEYASGSYLSGNNANISITPTSWYWIRFRLSGSSLYGKIWADGYNEPSSWTVTHTDATLSSGRVGLGSNHTTSDSYCDWFAAETNSESWPIPAPYSMSDFSLDLAVQANAFDYFKMILDVVEGDFFDFFPMKLGVVAQLIDSFKMLLEVVLNKIDDFKMLLDVTDGTVFDDFAMLLDVVDGTAFDNFKMELGVVSATPAFRSVTAHRVSSVLHEV